MGVDQSPAAVAAADKRMRRRKSATYHFVMEIWTESNSASLSTRLSGDMSLMFNPAPAAMLRSVARLVRAGGRSYFMRLTGMGSVQTPRPRFMMNATHGLCGRSNSRNQSLHGP